MLGTAAIAAAPPDGHTLGISTATPMAVNQVLYKKMSYDPDKDLTPVYFYVKSPFVLVVNPALPINSVPELIKYARESATPMSYSTPGAGTSQHLSMEFMAQRFGLKVTHVPYRSSRRIMSAPDMKKRASDIGLLPLDSPPIEGIRAYVKSEQEKWGSLVKKLGLDDTQ